MEKFIALDKRSKKEQRAYNNAQRGNWMGVNPCQRTFPDKKKFGKAQRSRDKAALRCSL